MRRRLLAAVLLVGLVATAGCAAFGPGPVDEDLLDENVTYDWDTDANATITIVEGRMKSVYRVENQTTFEAFRFAGFNDRGPVDPIGLRFRYPNGTITSLGEGAVTKHDSRTVISLPRANGTLAYAVHKEGKRLAIPILQEGTHVVILPPGTDAAYPILSHVTPGGYERVVREDEVALVWENPTGERLTVRYYLHRDLLLLGSLVAIASIALFVAGVRYWFQMRALRARREAVDVDFEDGPDS